MFQLGSLRNKSGRAAGWMALTLALWLLVQCQSFGQPAGPPPAPPSPAPAPALPLYAPPRRGDGTDLIDRLLENGVIRVGIRVWPEAEFSPPAFRGFSNAETGGALNGFEVDLARLLAEGLGLELELVEAYPPAITGGDWRGAWDIAIASLAPFDSPAGLVYSRPYGYMPMGVLVPAQASGLPGVGALAGRRVGVLEYSAYQQLLAAPDPPPTVWGGQPFTTQLPADVQPVALSNLLKAIRDLGQSGTDPPVEAIFGPVAIFEEAVKSEEPVRLLARADVLGVQPLVVAVAPQEGLKVDRLLAAINTVLDRLERRGTLAEVYLRWYGQDLSRPPTGAAETPVQ
ncbi:MAG: transporter substrate-binding domain-containing protein [Chloroflexota bacterium]